jgi:hypothetical protein
MIVIHDETKLLIERFALDLRPEKGLVSFSRGSLGRHPTYPGAEAWYGYVFGRIRILVVLSG